MRYVKIATCVAILLSGAASANLAFAGNKPPSPPGASVITPADQMKTQDQTGSPAPHGASTFTPGNELNTGSVSGTGGGASSFAPGVARGKNK